MAWNSPLAFNSTAVVKGVRPHVFIWRTLRDHPDICEETFSVVKVGGEPRLVLPFAPLAWPDTAAGRD
ncbi:MAG: hypothetical protein AB1758_01525 [Candidatus Eremiobacterota bacterium]